MTDGDELKVSSALLKVLNLAPSEGDEPSSTLFLAACLQQLAVEYGLVEREDEGFSWVAHALPGEPLRFLTDIITGGGAELTDDDLRDWLYDALLDISADSVARKSLNKTSAISQAEVLAFSQVYWNLEADGRRTELPIRSGQKLSNGLMARIKAPSGDVDLARVDLKNRAASAGFPKGGGAYYARGARVAALIADRITRDHEALVVGPARLHSTRTDRGVEWSIIWATRRHGDTAHRSSHAADPVAPVSLTSRARARLAVDSLEQDLRYAISRFIPDDFSPQEVFGPLYDRLRARQISTDEPDIEGMAAYLHPQESLDVLLTHADALPADLAAALRESRAAFDRFIPVRNRIIHGRPLQSDDLIAAERFLARLQSPNFPQASAALEQLRLDGSWQPRPRGGSVPPELVLHNLPDSDFDETGLLGREQLIDEIIARVERRREPTTLIGEGGIGKTALALAVCYRLVDDPEPVFDTILWTSLKTEQLTPAGVRALVDALRDIEGVTRTLGQVIDSGFEGNMAELADLIGDRSALIVIDNLETVHGDEFVRLYDALPASVTFLLTSRVGVGQIERPVAVGPLDHASAEVLYRKFARSSGVPQLAEQSSIEIGATLQALRYSPLAIRWYILSVEAGRPPTDVLRNQEELLRFCVGSVIDALHADEMRLLRVLRLLDRPLSFDELAVISEIEMDTLRRGAHHLMQRSLVVRAQSAADGEAELLALSSTARSFLPPTPQTEEDEAVYRRERAYEQERENARRWIANHGRFFDPNLIFERSPSDGPVAHLLRRALRESKAGNPEEAAQAVTRARAINPNYFEVDRLEAFFASISGRIETGTALYRSALDKCESEEERCWVGYFYSSHLARSVRDIPAAIELAEATHAFFGTYDTAHHLGNFYFWDKRFDEGSRLLEWAVTHAPTPQFRRKATTSLVECFRQWSDADLARQSAPDALAHALHAASVGLDFHHEGSADDKLIRAIIRTIPSVLRALREMSALAGSDEELLAGLLHRIDGDAQFRSNHSWSEVENTASALPEDLRAKVASWLPASAIDTTPKERLRGTIHNVGHKYGFIAHPKFPTNVFFHAGSVLLPARIDDLAAGSPVEFTPSKNHRGQDQALDVTLVGPEGAEPLDATE